MIRESAYYGMPKIGEIVFLIMGENTYLSASESSQVTERFRYDDEIHNTGVYRVVVPVTGVRGE